MCRISFYMLAAILILRSFAAFNSTGDIYYSCAKQDIRPEICYKLFDVKNYTRKNTKGNDIVTLYDAPGGFLDKVDFFTAIVEVNRSCRGGKHRYEFPIIKCYDKVKVISSVSWSFDPRSSGYQYSGKPDNFIKRGSMIPTMQQLINLSAWSTELCSTTKVEVQNDSYGH